MAALYEKKKWNKWKEKMQTNFKEEAKLQN